VLAIARRASNAAAKTRENWCAAACNFRTADDLLTAIRYQLFTALGSMT
jgi:hypothetical protein